MITKNKTAIVGIGGAGNNMIEYLKVNAKLNCVSAYHNYLLYQAIENNYTVVLVCGLGGIYGSTNIVKIAVQAVALKKEVYAVVTMPAQVEGKLRIETAQAALKKLHAIVSIKNIKIIEISKHIKVTNLSFQDVQDFTYAGMFKKVNEQVLDYIIS